MEMNKTQNRRVLILLGVAIGAVCMCLPADAAPIGYVDQWGYECISDCPYPDHTQCPEPDADWRYVGLPSDTSATGGGQPAASSSIAVNKVVRQSIFTQAKPKAQPKKPAQPAQPEGTTTEAKPPAFYENMGHFGRLNSGAADVFYNKWEVGESDGSTFGINPSVTWGETDELTLTAPLHIIDGGDDTIFALGLDGAYKHPFTGKWEKFSAGVHAYGLGYFGGDDNASTFGGGPFLSWNYRINPKWVVSAGGLLEFTKPDEGDTITEIVPGVNVGYNLSDNVALNGYLIHYKNLDSDAGDDAYTDVGADVQWVKGSWSLSGGIKTATGLEDVSSTEIYLGSNWMF